MTMDTDDFECIADESQAPDTARPPATARALSRARSWLACIRIQCSASDQPSASSRSAVAAACPWRSATGRRGRRRGARRRG